MNTLSGFSILQLRAATAAQIRTAMTTRLGLLDRKQLIRLDLYCASYDKNAVVTLPGVPIRKTGPHGQTEYVEEQADVLGAVVKTVKTEWSYYPSGCVQDIVTTETDSAGNVTKKRTVHHFEDGKQPTLIEE